MGKDTGCVVMDIYEVVKRLVGPINPIGEANEDDRRLNSLKVLCELVDRLVEDIDEIGEYYKGRQEYSVKKAAKFADNFLKNGLGIQ